MALPDNLLSPIPGENPSGQNLRYAPIYEKIKEARREEEDLPQGEWSREVKTADPVLVMKLTTEALATKSKDLQLVAWLTEALLRQEGFDGLKEGLDLLAGMIRNFWDTVYPEPEDGDAELRAAPLNWVGSYLNELVRKTPLTPSGFDWFKYLESRTVGYEKACAGNEVKTAARQTAIAEHKLTPEAFDEDMESTARDFYVQLVEGIDGALGSLQSLDELCEQKLGHDSPSFSKLRTALEEVQSLAQAFLKTKPAPELEHAETAELPSPTIDAQPAPARPRVVTTEEPVDHDDALRRIFALARYLRNAEPYSPAPYLILRGLRWGELRAGNSSQVPELLEPPSTETRQQLKRLALEGLWGELLEAAETAMALRCGRAWLDLQRYVVRACQELGSDYDAIAAAVRSGVSALVKDLPWLTECTFLDDTPAANAETLKWLQEIAGLSHSAIEPFETAPILNESAPGNGDVQVMDAQVLAMQAARSGRTEEALEILTREIAQEPSGRARFERKIQLASLCLSVGHESIAYPILRELADEIQRRKLEEWESAAVLVKPLALLFGCLTKMGGHGEERQRVYELICRLDPVQALACLK